MSDWTNEQKAELAELYKSGKLYNELVASRAQLAALTSRAEAAESKLNVIGVRNIRNAMDFDEMKERAEAAEAQVAALREMLEHIRDEYMPTAYAHKIAVQALSSLPASPATEKLRVKELEGALSFEQFAQANRARCESPQGFGHPLSGWSASDWMTALTGEVGEAANVVKKLNRYRDGVPGNKLTEQELRDQLRRELGDVFVYLDLFAQALGFKIADAAVEVFDAKSVEIGYRAASALKGEG